ncbi:MAG: hypothetical protein R3E01_26835 [Pirellulaceae bacterium]
MTYLLDDYRWLTGPDAAPWLRVASEYGNNIVRASQILRRELSAERTHLVLEQLELRKRGREKFRLADQLFFTRKGLEQSSGDAIATYKGSLFRRDTRTQVADLCCGIAGDAMQLHAVHDVVAVDWDPVHAWFAQVNLESVGYGRVAVLQRDVCTVELRDHWAWHLDPDRRADGRRSTQIDHYAPNASQIRKLLSRNGNGMIKIAPAADVPGDWLPTCERLWVGYDRACPQQLLLFGELAERVQSRSAVVIDDHGKERQSLHTIGEPPLPPLSAIGQFLHDPHPCVVAARLVSALALRANMSAVDRQVAYLSSDDPFDGALADSFRVVDIMPFDRRRLARYLQQRRIGTLEIKQRGVKIVPEHLRKELRLSGDQAAVLFLLPYQHRVTAVLSLRGE